MWSNHDADEGRIFNNRYYVEVESEWEKNRNTKTAVTGERVVTFLPRDYKRHERFKVLPRSFQTGRSSACEHNWETCFESDIQTCKEMEITRTITKLSLHLHEHSMVGGRINPADAVYSWLEFLLSRNPSETPNVDCF